jgi:hypothetical protein
MTSNLASEVIAEHALQLRKETDEMDKAKIVVAKFDVIIKMASLHSIVFPLPSVNLP